MEKKLLRPKFVGDRRKDGKGIDSETVGPTPIILPDQVVRPGEPDGVGWGHIVMGPRM